MTTWQSFNFKWLNNLIGGSGGVSSTVVGNLLVCYYDMTTRQWQCMQHQVLPDANTVMRRQQHPWQQCCLQFIYRDLVGGDFGLQPLIIFALKVRKSCTTVLLTVITWCHYILLFRIYYVWLKKAAAGKGCALKAFLLSSRPAAPATKFLRFLWTPGWQAPDASRSKSSLNTTHQLCVKCPELTVSKETNFHNYFLLIPLVWNNLQTWRQSAATTSWNWG